MSIGAAVLGGSLIQGASSIFGAQSAAHSQKKAAAIAAAMQQRAYEDTLAQEQPYLSLGNAASGELKNRLTDLSSPVTMDQDTLERTPGYQFNLAQGLKSVQNSAAARGLGSSGAALKGAGTYATGLADSTYQNQFNNAWTNKTNGYNMLAGGTTIGQNAVNSLASVRTGTATNMGNAMIGAGNAQGAASIATGNAIGNSVNNGLNSYLLYNKLFGAGNGSSGMYGTGSLW